MTFAITGQYLNNIITYEVKTEDYNNFDLSLKSPGEIKKLLPESLKLTRGQQYFSNLDNFLMRLIEEWRNEV